MFIKSLVSHLSTESVLKFRQLFYLYSDWNADIVHRTEVYRFSIHFLTNVWWKTETLLIHTDQVHDIRSDRVWFACHLTLLSSLIMYRTLVPNMI